MFIPTAIATELAAQRAEARAGAARHRITLPRNPFAAIARARLARRPAACATC